MTSLTANRWHVMQSFRLSTNVSQVPKLQIIICPQTEGPERVSVSLTVTGYLHQISRKYGKIQDNLYNLKR